jgi:acyl carrier protein
MIVKTISELATLIARKQISLENFFYKKTGCIWDYSAKTFDEMDADSLDVIEAIMYLEKVLDCVIPDDLGDLILVTNPNDLIVSVIRQRKLEELGI